MLIEQVLRAKGRDVTTVKADDTLKSVADLLDMNRIGAAVALDDAGVVVGVVSERDIVRHLARSGESVVNIQVREAMTRDVITAAPGESVEDVPGAHDRSPGPPPARAQWWQARRPRLHR